MKKEFFISIFLHTIESGERAFWEWSILLLLQLYAFFCKLDKNVAETLLYYMTNR